MKGSFTLAMRVVLASAFFQLTPAQAVEAVALVPAQECQPRQGWPNFLRKVSQPGAEVRVAYLGGSITAQPGWRPKTLAHFQETWPQAKISEINAAIGGTGSDLGVFRLKQDVLDHQPDLLLVEFAVNDGGAEPEQILRCMEGIVRQTWRIRPHCDIGFVYTLTEALAPAMLEGKFQRSASAMEKVADHYGIPTIHLGMEVARLAREGRLVWRAALPKTQQERKVLGDKLVFAPDGVHPHPETGHQLYLEAVVRSMKPIRDASGKAVSHALKQPLSLNNYERAALIPVTAAMAQGGMRALDLEHDRFGKRWASRMQTLFCGDKAGQALVFRFKGTRCAIYDVVGPDCGQVSVTLDGTAPRIVPRIDAYGTYHRLSTFVIGSDLEDKIHEVRIEVHPQSPDKAAILAKRGQRIADPKQFEGTCFYPGALLLVGELVE